MIELTFLHEKLIEAKEVMARDMAQQVGGSDSVKMTEELEEQVHNLRLEFIEILADSLIKTRNESEEQMGNWAKKIGEMAINYGAPLEDTLENTKFFRRFIWHEIKKIVNEHKLSNEVIFTTAEHLDPILDHSVYIFSLSYVDHHQETLLNAQNAFLELSAPIVPITDHVAVLPLIGDIDTHRAQILLEESMKKSVEYKLNKIFIDLSGVVMVDTMVAHEILKITSSLALLGVQATLTGIRPEIAQTMVTLGIEFPNITTRATLKQAIQELGDNAFSPKSESSKLNSFI